MKQSLKNTVKVKYILLSLCLIIFCKTASLLCTNYAIYLNYHMVPSEWTRIIGLFLILILSFIGEFIIILLMFKHISKRKMLIKSGQLVLIAIVLYAGINVGCHYISGIIYNSMTGSIAIAKMYLDIVNSIIKVPINAVLLCLLGNLIGDGKIIRKVTVKRYFTALISCLIIWIIQFLFSLVPNGLYLIIIKDIVLGICSTILIAIVLNIKENIKNEVA